VGVWDVDALAEQMPAALLEEWMAYLRIEPQGAFADDTRWSGLMALTANQNRGKRKMIEPSKFSLMRDERQRDLYQKFKSWAIAAQAQGAKPVEEPHGEFTDQSTGQTRA
jgi:hypothetical protein